MGMNYTCLGSDTTRLISQMMFRSLNQLRKFCILPECPEDDKIDLEEGMPGFPGKVCPPPEGEGPQGGGPGARRQPMYALVQIN